MSVALLLIFFFRKPPENPLKAKDSLNLPFWRQKAGTFHRYVHSSDFSPQHLPGDTIPVKTDPLFYSWVNMSPLVKIPEVFTFRDQQLLLLAGLGWMKPVLYQVTIWLCKCQWYYYSGKKPQKWKQSSWESFQFSVLLKAGEHILECLPAALGPHFPTGKHGLHMLYYSM